MLSRTQAKFSHSSLCSLALASALIMGRQHNVTGIQKKHYNLREEVSCCGKITSGGYNLIVMWAHNWIGFHCVFTKFEFSL
jgi:hypothetical protein